MTVRRIRFLAWCAFALLPLASAPLPALADAGTLTLAEGNVRLLRGTALLQAGESVRIQPGDILETEKGATHVVEFADGLRLGLGPATRAYLVGPAPRGKGGDASGAIVLLSGWIKLESGKQPPSDGYRVLTRQFGLSTASGKLLVSAADERCSAFVESGSARLIEVDEGGRLTRSAALSAGQFASRAAPQRLVIAERPAPDFLAGMPRGFRDALPSRADRLAAAARAPKSEREVRYDDVADWLSLPQGWRGELMPRYQPRLRDADFRKAVAANIARHPEWHPILFPPKAPETAPAMPGY